MYSQDEISISMRYNQHLLPTLRSIPGSKWNADKYVWTIPATTASYTQAIEALSLNTSRVSTEVTPLPDAVVRVLENELKLDAFDTAARMHEIETCQLWQVLKEFQRKGVAEAIKRGGRMLLGDEMGLGKTVQSLAIARAYKDEWPVLIVCPSSLRLTWKAEIQQWLEIPDDEIHVSFKGADVTSIQESKTTIAGNAKRLKTNTIRFHIVSYDLATREVDTIKAKSYKVIICDESHYLKNPMVIAFLGICSSQLNSIPGVFIDKTQQGSYPIASEIGTDYTLVWHTGVRQTDRTLCTNHSNQTEAFQELDRVWPQILQCEAWPVWHGLQR